MNWGFCHLGVNGLCGNKFLLHLIAFTISIPFCLIHKMGFFVMTSLISTVVIFVTSSQTCYRSKHYHGIPVFRCLQLWDKLKSNLVQFLEFPWVLRCDVLCNWGNRPHFPHQKFNERIWKIQVDFSYCSLSNSLLVLYLRHFWSDGTSTFTRLSVTKQKGSFYSSTGPNPNWLLFSRYHTPS